MKISRKNRQPDPDVIWWKGYYVIDGRSRLIHGKVRASLLRKYIIYYQEKYRK